jgi:hypothetical protein
VAPFLASVRGEDDSGHRVFLPKGIKDCKGLKDRAVLAMPDEGADDDFTREPDQGRDVEL